MNVSFALSVAQIIVAVILSVFILLQQRGAALGSAFGGGDNAAFTSRRGIEKNFFIASIVLGALFIALALLQLKF